MMIIYSHYLLRAQHPKRLLDLSDRIPCGDNTIGDRYTATTIFSKLKNYLKSDFSAFVF
jgi:hypothetical protein